MTTTAEKQAGVESETAIKKIFAKFDGVCIFFILLYVEK
jgi:hypothetical protein